MSVINVHQDLALANVEIASLREELRAEREKFQQETRRTSELVEMLREARRWILLPDGAMALDKTAIADQIEELLAKPVNAADVAALVERCAEEIDAKVTAAVRAVADRLGPVPTPTEGDTMDGGKA